jgi:hypothetical protein
MDIIKMITARIEELVQKREIEMLGYAVRINELEAMKEEIIRTQKIERESSVQRDNGNDN